MVFIIWLKSKLLTMAKLKNLVSDHIVNQAGESVEWESLSGAGKTIGLYYSAHWCPPCRKFTPMLAEFYKKLKGSDKGKDFEIIFVSSDADDNAFNDYYKEMPWLALKFDQRAAKVINLGPVLVTMKLKLVCVLYTLPTLSCDCTMSKE